MSQSRRNGSSGCGGLLLALFVIAGVLYAVSALGNLLGLTPTFDELSDERTKGYENVALGYALTVALIALPFFLFFAVRWARRAHTGEATVLSVVVVLPVALVALLVVVAPAGPIGEAPSSPRAVQPSSRSESADDEGALAGRRPSPVREKDPEPTQREPKERALDGAPPASPSASVPEDAKETTVSENTDGDTVVLAATGPSRLIGVDTPEVYFGEECFGAEASAYTAERLAPGTTVFYERGVEATDQYGRALVYIWLSGGTFYNAELVREGYATPLSIAPNTRYASEFNGYAARARSEDAGLWGRAGCAGRPEKSTPPASSSAPASPPAGGASGGGCTPGYDPCLPPASDYDCPGGGGDPDSEGRGQGPTHGPPL